MGVSGCGKSTIAKSLAKALNILFIEADDFHPQSNKDKMKSGQPLNDDDRLPWLENLAKVLAENEENGCVLACSALKASYRVILNASLKEPLQIIFLKGSYDLIKDRMDQRHDHFMPSQLLRNQFTTLESPKTKWTFNIKEDPDKIIQDILLKIKKY